MIIENGEFLSASDIYAMYQAEKARRIHAENALREHIIAMAEISQESEILKMEIQELKGFKK